MATKKVKVTKEGVEVDLSGVTASDRRRKTRIPEGSYLGKVVGASGKKFGTGSRGVEWIFEVTTPGKGKGARFWYNNVLVNADGEVAENNLWAFKGVLQALEPKIKIPDSMVKVPLKKLVGKAVALEIADGEYEGKVRSEVIDVFHPSLLEEDEDEDELEEEDDDLDDEDEDDLDEEEEDEDDDEIDLEEDEL